MDQLEGPIGRSIPAIALTGPLGAGKTTVLNGLLRQSGARIGVVVNDFGAVEIDAALIAGQIDEAASIAGGCICCLPDGGGLDDALERLSAPRLRLDAIVVEASGVAEPAALGRALRCSGAERVRLGGVVEVVDAVAVHEGRGPSAARLAPATLLVVTKLDLLAPDDADAALAAVRALAGGREPAVPVVGAERGRIDPALVLDAAHETEDPDQLPIAALLQEAEPHTHPRAASVSLPLPQPVDGDALVDLLESPPAGVSRIKGIVPVRTASGARRFVVHVVDRLVHVGPAARSVPESAHGIVCIGATLDEAGVRRALETLLTPTPPRASGLRRLQRLARLSR